MKHFTCYSVADLTLRGSHGPFLEKSYPQKIPKFADLLIEYYEKWQDGELDLDELKEDLWKYGGVKFREGQINGK